VVLFALLAVGAMEFWLFVCFVVVFFFVFDRSISFEVVFGCNLSSCSSGLLFS
jgi:hypothetical protein